MSCRPRLLLLLLVTLVGSHTGRQPAGAQHQLTIKAATIAPPGSPLARQLEDLGTWLASLESPPFKLKVFAAGALGNEASVAKRTREGSLQLYAGSLSGLASVLPEVSVLLTPYLFKSIAQAERRLDRAVLKQLRPLLQEHGLVFAAWGPAQLRSYYSASAPLSGPKDFAGRPTHQRPLPGSPQVLAALNATAVAMPLGELSEALGDGRVDAFDDTLEGSFASGRIHRAQHLTLTHHGLDARILVFSKRWLDGLPAAARAELERLPAELTATARERSKALEQTLLGHLAKLPIQVAEPPDRARRELTRVLRRTGTKTARELGHRAVQLLRAAN